MNRLLSAELLKLRTVRAPLALAAAGLVYAVANALATVALAGRQGNTPLGHEAVLGNVLRGGGVANWVVLLVAILTMAGEYQHRTITLSLLVSPQRHRLVAAKLLTITLLGAGYAVVIMVSGLVVAAPAIVGHDVHLALTDPSIGRVALGVVLTGILHGAAGVAVGALTRHTAAAAIGTIAWIVVAENVIGSIAGWGIVRYLPGQAAAAAAGAGGGRLLPMAAGGALFAGYALVATAAAARLTVSRDIA